MPKQPGSNDTKPVSHKSPPCALSALSAWLHRSSSFADTPSAAPGRPEGVADGKPASAPSSASHMLTDAPFPQPLSESQRPARSSTSLPIKQVTL